MATRREFIEMAGAVAGGMVLNACREAGVNVPETYEPMTPGLGTDVPGVTGTAVPVVPTVLATDTQVVATAVATEQRTNHEVVIGQPTEYGFTTHMRLGGSAEDNLTWEQFQNDVEWMALQQCTQLRFDVQSEQVASWGNAEGIGWHEGNLDVYTQAIDYALARGIEVHLVLGGPTFGTTMSMDEYERAFSLYCGGLAERWQGKVTTWQIFNEPTMHHFQNYAYQGFVGGEYLEQVARMVGAASRAIKMVDATSQITATVSRWWGGEPVDVFIAQTEQFYDAMAQAIDLIGLDLYPDDNEAEIQRLPEFVRHFTWRYGKSVVVAEIGIGTKIFSEQRQGELLARYMATLEAGEVKPGAVFIYELNDDVTDPEGGGSMGIFRADGTPKVGAGMAVQSLGLVPEADFVLHSKASDSTN